MGKAGCGLLRTNSAATALNYFAHNSIKIHRTLRASRAMAAGVTVRLREVADLVASGRPMSNGGRKERRDWCDYQVREICSDPDGHTARLFCRGLAKARGQVVRALSHRGNGYRSAVCKYSHAPEIKVTHHRNALRSIRPGETGYRARKQKPEPDQSKARQEKNKSKRKTKARERQEKDFSLVAGKEGPRGSPGSFQKS
jgi:hypothetical protein